MSLAVVLAMGTLSACGSSETATNTETPAADTAATETATTEAADATTATDATADGEVVDPKNWDVYDSLISEIKSTTDYVNREALMHQAEDMLMETGAILPIYYYNDIYMQRSTVSNVYSNLYGFKYFMFAETGSDTFKLNLASEPDSLDPALNSSVDGSCLVVNSFAGLFSYDNTGLVQPDLVADYTVSEDGMTYTFNLLPDLKWSDGSALTANDFVYSWNRAVAEETAADYGYMFDAIARKDDGTLDVTASEDGQSLTVVLGSPCVYFLDLCAFPAYYPVPQASVEAAEGWEENPGTWAQEAGFVTNGAYTLESWAHEESMVYVKNPN